MAEYSWVDSVPCNIKYIIFFCVIVKNVLKRYKYGIVFFGLLVTLGLSIYAIVFPDTPSDSIIAAAGIKVINVGFDISFFVSQRNIIKTHRSVISEANYAAALAALLFDSVTLVSLFF